MSVKDSITVDFDTLRCSVAKPCDEKYARKLLQDWFKENTSYRGGWEVTKDFRRWDDPEHWNFTISNPFAGLSYYKIESQVENETMDEFYARRREERQKNANTYSSTR